MVSLTASRAFKVGDFIKADGGKVFGHVERITFRTTHVRAKWDGHLVQVPNSKLVSSAIENLSTYEWRRGKWKLRARTPQQLGPHPRPFHCVLQLIQRLLLWRPWLMYVCARPQ